MARQRRIFLSCGGTNQDAATPQTCYCFASSFSDLSPNFLMIITALEHIGTHKYSEPDKHRMQPGS